MKILDYIVGFPSRADALTGWRFEERVESQRLRVAQSRTAFLIVSIGGTIYVFGLWDEVSHFNLLAWVGICVAITAIRDRVCKWVNSTLGDITVAGIYRNELWLYFTSLANTTAVGAGYWLVAYGSSERTILIVTLLSCLYAVGTTVNSAMHSRHIRELLATNLGQGVVFMLIARDPPEIEVAFAISALAYLLVKFCNRISRQFMESIRIRDENRAKNLQLEQQKQVIEESLRAAKMANDDKNRFLAAASHDLRQPLHAMTLFLGSLRKTVKDDLSLELVGKIHQTTSLLHEQFDSLLDLSKFDAGVVEPNMAPCRISLLLKKLVDDVAAQAESKGLAIELETEDAVISTDALLIERLLRNLLNNAIQFTEEGSILVRLVQKDDKLVIEVTDSGIGIAEEDQGRIFQDYYQVSNKARTKGKGSGLGLAIVNRIAKLLDLKLAVSSEQGSGSTFSVCIPNSVDDQNANMQQQEQESALFESETNEVQRLIQLNSEMILVVDDDVSVLDALSGLIRDCGGLPTTASNLEDVKRLQKDGEHFDAAILDDMLHEEHSGLDIAVLLSGTMNPNRILITTGNTDTRRLDKIRHEGFEVLTKPVDYLRLQQVIDELVS